MTEEWRPVAGFEGRYEVSSLGNVRSWVYSSGKGVHRRETPRLLKPGRTKKGHLYVFLGRGNRRSVHSLVCEAFHGTRPVGMQVCHWNDIPDDNRAENLRWGTPKDNTADSRRNGRMPMGRDRANAKLNEELVRELRTLYAQGANMSAECRRLGINPGTAQSAYEGKSWRHVV